MSRAPAARETAQETGSEALAVAEAVAPAQFLTSASRVLQRPPSSITGMIPRMPELLPNFSVPSVSTQSVLNARRQS
jgi:hypothetical protein